MFHHCPQVWHQMNKINHDRRTYHRIPFQAELFMQSGNDEWSCNLLDISLKGMLVEPPDNLDIDTRHPCALALFLGEEAAINARVKIARVMKNGNWGLEWLHIDVEGLRHLRRLMELNLNDTGLLNRELVELG
jgi:hypothetical protein